MYIHGYVWHDRTHSGGPRGDWGAKEYSLSFEPQGSWSIHIYGYGTILIYDMYGGDSLGTRLAFFQSHSQAPSAAHGFSYR